MPRKRQKQFVDGPVQGSILLRLIMHWSVLMFAVLSFLFFVELVSGPPREAWRNLWTRHGPTLAAVLVFLPMFLRDLTKLTNRFAGPMVRLRRAMKELAAGKQVRPIKFRDHDFWQELAEDFNQVLARVQGQPDSAGAESSSETSSESGGQTASASTPISDDEFHDSDKIDSPRNDSDKNYEDNAQTTRPMQTADI